MRVARQQTSQITSGVQMRQKKALKPGPCVAGGDPGFRGEEVLVCHGIRDAGPRRLHASLRQGIRWVNVIRVNRKSRVGDTVTV